VTAAASIKTLPAILAIVLSACGGLRDPKASSTDPAIQKYLHADGFAWLQHSTAHLDLFYSPKRKSDRDIRRVCDSAEAALAHVIKLTGTAGYAPRIHVFLLESPDEMQRLMGSYVEGRSRPTEHTVFYVTGPDRTDIRHELTHEVATNAWGAAENWIEEGFATYAAQLPGCITREPGVDKPALVSIEKFVTPRWTSVSYPLDVTYPELCGFVTYLIDTYGMDRFIQVWKHGKASFEDVYQLSVVAAGQDWERWQRRRR
jgi:hypothetical protein